MKSLRRLVASVLFGACLALTAVTSAVADGPLADVEPCAGSTITNHGVNNGFLAFNNGRYRTYIDHRIQRASDRMCHDYLRAAVNFRCQELNQVGTWVPVNCGSSGIIYLWVDGWEKGRGYAFGSTGSDGLITVYGPWIQFAHCTNYESEIYIGQITMNYREQWGGGRVGKSHLYRDC